MTSSTRPNHHSTQETRDPCDLTGLDVTIFKRRHRRKWTVCLSCGLLCGIIWLKRVFLLGQLGGFLDVGAPLEEPVDAVYVLGGGLETRPFVAAEIYRAGYVTKILIPAPARSSAMDDFRDKSEMELTRLVLERMNVPSDRIVELHQEVESTRGEALSLREYVTVNPIRRIGVVTSNFHTRRARGIFGETFSDSKIEFEWVSVPTDGFDGSNWWRYEAGVETYLLEWVKYLTYCAGLS